MNRTTQKVLDSLKSVYVFENNRYYYTFSTSFDFTDNSRIKILATRNINLAKRFIESSSFRFNFKIKSVNNELDNLCILSDQDFSKRFLENYEQ